MSGASPIKLSPENFLEIYKGFLDQLHSFLDGSHPNIGKPGSFMDFIRSLVIFLDKAQNELRSKEEQAIQLNRRIEDYFEMKRKFADSLVDNEELKTSMVKKDNEIASLKEERKSLSDKIVALMNEKHESEQKAEELFKSFYELKQMHKQSEAVIHKLEENIGKVEENAQAKLNILVAEMEKESVSVIKSLEEKISQLEQENKTLQKSIKHQERSDNTMKELIEKVNALEEEKKEKENKLQTLMKEHEIEKLRFKEENEDLQSDLEECNQLISDHAAHIEELKEELKRSEKKIEELEQENTEVEESEISEPNMDLVTEQMNQMNQRVLRLNSVVEKLLAENEYLKRELMT